MLKHLLCALLLVSCLHAGPNDAYVADSLTSIVNVIDISKNSVIATITVGPGPTSVAMTPDGTKVYATNFGVTSISVIDTSNEQVTGNISTALAGQPFYIAITPDGSKAYFTVDTGGDNAVYVLDTATDTIVGTIILSLVTTTSQQIAISQTGLVYVANSDTQNVSVIDSATDMVVATIPIGGDAIGVALSLNGKFLYVTDTTNGTVVVIDPITNTVTQTIPLGSALSFLDFTPDGTKAYVPAFQLAKVFVIDTGTNMVTGEIAVGNSPTDVAFSPDGKFAYVTNQTSNTVTVIDVATEMVVDTISVADGPFDIFIRAHGTRVSASSEENTFLTQTELFNRVIWNPLPTTSATTGFRVYRDVQKTQLIATLPAGTTQFLDHNREPGETYTYFVSQIIEGLEIDLGSSAVTP